MTRSLMPVSMTVLPSKISPFMGDAPQISWISRRWLEPVPAERFLCTQHIGLNPSTTFLDCQGGRNTLDAGVFELLICLLVLGEGASPVQSCYTNHKLRNYPPEFPMLLFVKISFKITCLGWGVSFLKHSPTWGPGSKPQHLCRKPNTMVYPSTGQAKTEGNYNQPNLWAKQVPVPGTECLRWW